MSRHSTEESHQYLNSQIWIAMIKYSKFSILFQQLIEQSPSSTAEDHVADLWV